MNEKLKQLANTIERIIRIVFPEDYLSAVSQFGKYSISDLVNQVLVECSKHAYDVVTEKNSLLFYLKELNNNPDEEEKEQRRVRRTIEYINAHRDSLYEYLIKNGIDAEGLKSPEMKTMSEKIAGYKLTPFQFWEINNVHDIKLIKSIVEKRLCKKNFTIDKFLEFERQYNDVLKTALNNIDNGIDIIENFLKIFILEGKYSFDFYYALSQCMVQNKVTSIDDCQFKIKLFSGITPLFSAYNGDGIKVLSDNYSLCENRLLILRPNYIQTIVKSDEEEFKRSALYYNEGRYIVANILTHMTYQGLPLRDWFVCNTSQEDWKDVFLNYNINSVINIKKDWNNTRTIRYMKSLYNNT